MEINVVTDFWDAPGTELQVVEEKVICWETRVSNRSFWLLSTAIHPIFWWRDVQKLLRHWKSLLVLFLENRLTFTIVLFLCEFKFSAEITSLKLFLLFTVIRKWSKFGLFQGQFGLSIGLGRRLVLWEALIKMLFFLEEALIATIHLD